MTLQHAEYQTSSDALICSQNALRILVMLCINASHEFIVNSRWCEPFAAAVDDALSVMRMGTENRRIGETNLNRESSRSHSVFTCIMESSSKGAEDGCTRVKFSRLNLVDLAGEPSNTCAHSFCHSLTLSLIHLLTHSLTRSLARSPIHLSVCSVNQSVLHDLVSHSAVQLSAHP